MKKLIALIVVLASVMMANAKSVVFTLSNGTLVYYLLGGETNPVMKFVDGKIVVNTDTYEFSNVKNFYISDEDDPVGIKSTVAKKNVQFANNTLVVKGNAQNVNVYSVNGAKVEAAMSETDGYVSVDMSGLQKGTYVVKIGDSSVKVLKK